MSAITSQELKGLQVRRNKAEAELSQINHEMKELAKRQSEAQKLINNLQEQIKAISQSEPVVSEHALLRYMERVQGMDIEKTKREILTDERIQAIKFMRNGKIALPSGHSIVVRDRTVVTVE